MNADRLDLSPLDPSADASRWEWLVASIVERASPELSRRAARNSLLGSLADWAWPALSAAAVLAVVSGAALALTRQPAEAQPTVFVAEALEVSEPVRLWLDEGRAPTRSDLVLVLGGQLQ
ncbi:MAG: hypothetical protein ACRELX_09165 [Longimicrobiales bacterium]